MSSQNPLPPHHPKPIMKRGFYYAQNKVGLPYPNFGLDQNSDELPILCHCYMEPNFTFYVCHEGDVPTLYRNGCFGYSNLTRRGPSSMLFRPFEKAAYYRKMMSRMTMTREADVDNDDQLESDEETTVDIDTSLVSEIEIEPSKVIENGDETDSFVTINDKSKEIPIPNGNPNITRHTPNGNGNKVHDPPTPPVETEKLILLPEEVIFLSFAVGCLTITCTNTSETLSYQDVWKLLSKNNPEFPAKYAVYHYFRSKHWVPKSGTQFGGDYVLYQMGPEFYHSTYIVHIIGLSSRPRLTWTELYSRQRLATTSKKSALMCEVSIPDDFIPETSSPLSIFDMVIRETLVRRWNPMTRI